MCTGPTTRKDRNNKFRLNIVNEQELVKEMYNFRHKGFENKNPNITTGWNSKPLPFPDLLSVFHQVQWCDPTIPEFSFNFVIEKC